jgi:hypothetical protein
LNTPSQGRVRLSAAGSRHLELSRLKNEGRPVDDHKTLQRTRPDAWAVSWDKRCLLICEFTKPNGKSAPSPQDTATFKTAQYTADSVLPENRNSGLLPEWLADSSANAAAAPVAASSVTLLPPLPPLSDRCCHCSTAAAAADAACCRRTDSLDEGNECCCSTLVKRTSRPVAAALGRAMTNGGMDYQSLSNQTCCCCCCSAALGRPCSQVGDEERTARPQAAAAALGRPHCPISATMNGRTVSQTD